MPVITVTLLPGYAPEVEQRLVGRLATATRSVIAAAPAGTTVYVSHASTYQRDDRVLTEAGSARPVASDIVRAFLQSMQDRDLPGAGRWLAPGFTMCFPGGTTMNGLDELIDWARGRYRQVAKDFGRFDESWTGEGAVVYCSGTLRGTWNDGRDFSGVRFIDRFEVANGLIQRQDVWNDLAEVAARTAER
jgi:hypothetical protein